MTTTIGDHAVVLGGSMAGLLAARVLSEHYAQVTVVERDMLPAAGGHRRGVPQSRHVHGILPRGRELLDKLFSGLTAELVGAGALTGDSLGCVRWLLSGHRLAQTTSGSNGLLVSRPLLEDQIRARTRGISAVTIRDGLRRRRPGCLARPAPDHRGPAPTPRRRWHRAHACGGSGSGRHRAWRPRPAVTADAGLSGVAGARSAKVGAERPDRR